jgi:hypothetical protein
MLDRTRALRFFVSTRLVPLAVLMLAGTGCTVRQTSGTDAGTPTASCMRGRTFVCNGTVATACNPDGSDGARTDCATSGALCVEDVGCRVCTPNAGGCDGDVVRRCRPDGSGWDPLTTCDASMGEVCNAPTTSCINPCATAAAHHSYFGCDFWPVPTLNNSLRVIDTGTGMRTREAFDFAVAVANPQNTPVTVRALLGTRTLAMRTIDPGAIEAIPLPWDERLQPIAGATGEVESVSAPNGAYHLVATAPVIAYQFNPLEYQAPGSLTTTMGRTTYSFSNDASMLIPSGALTGNYLVITQPTHQMHQVLVDLGDPTHVIDVTPSSPGFMALVGTMPGTTNVTVTFSAHVVASVAGTAVSGYGPGDVAMFHLTQGQVLQITSAAPPTCAVSGSDHTVRTLGGTDYDVTIEYCDVGPDYDLTGTLVRADMPIELVSGHNCTFVPHNRWACDHLEETMLPLETWGTSAIVPITQPLRGEPNVIRIVSSHDGNMLTFDPSSVHAPVTLDRGQYVDFEASESFRVEGTAAIGVAQLLVGQDYAGYESTPANDIGDPSLSLAIPTAQYRTEYTFLTPTTYAESFVGVTAPMGSDVMLDGAPVTGLAPVGGSGFGVANVMVGGGAHTMTSSTGFGIVVYGFGSYTSYMYPGGLDLTTIDMPF